MTGDIYRAHGYVIGYCDAHRKGLTIYQRANDAPGRTWYVFAPDGVFTIGRELASCSTRDAAEAVARLMGLP